MRAYIALAIALLILGFVGYRAGRIWIDAGRRGMALPQRLRWSLWGTALPASYWWGARIEAMPPREQEELLARETEALGLSRADSLRCPLCESEVPRAWALSPDGKPTVAAGPVECPGCDFRLDACRHCTQFLTGPPGSWGQPVWMREDLTTGRCNRYKSWQPVEQTTTPDMARQMRARGYDRIRAPMTIMDSFLPPDHCRAFEASRQRLKEGGIRLPGARRAALLRLLAGPAPPEPATGEQFPTGDEEWLL